MAVSNEVTINLEKFINSGLEEAIGKALEKACLIVENDAKINCPVDNGQLRSSITHQIEGTTGIIGTNVEYAPYVEKGTGIYADGGRETPWRYETADGEWHTTEGQKPQPFLEPALTANIGRIRDCFKEIV
mgnify:CR=1 FL=1